MINETDTCIDNAINWIEMLASADYPQATGVLGERGGRCCLGVAREIDSYGEQLSDTELYPRTAEDKFGLIWGAQGCLAKMNDKGVPHPEIAMAMIEYAERFFFPSVAKAIKQHFAEGVL